MDGLVEREREREGGRSCREREREVTDVVFGLMLFTFGLVHTSAMSTAFVLFAVSLSSRRFKLCVKKRKEKNEIATRL